MFGLDESIASLASAEPLAALAAALLLGLRHPLDPDHLAAVGAMTAASSERGRGALIGLHWGLGHATTVLMLGTPLILWAAVMPGGVQRGLEAAIGIVIIALGLRLLLRHGRGGQHAHPHPPPRSLREAYRVGLIHGVGGSAGIGLLLLASIPDEASPSPACSCSRSARPWR